MNFFDLHCDTITECCKHSFSLRENPLHLDLNRGSVFDAWAQVYAIWIPDSLRGGDAWDCYQKNLAYFRSQVEQFRLHFCTNEKQADAIPTSPSPTALLAVEGGAVLSGEAEKLELLYADGVRVLTLTWNGENELGFGCQSAGGHLKPFGRQVLRRMETLRMIPDVSHLDRIGFYDVLELTGKPVLASHSTSLSVLRETRNESLDKSFSIRRALDDEQIRALALHGGLIGLNFCGSFLGDPGRDGMQAALRHALHILEIGGTEILAIGSDFDGCTINPEMAGIETMPRLYDYFLNNGLDRETCEKIFFNNAWQFMKSVL